MQNELKIANETKNSVEIRPMRPGYAYFRFLLRMLKRNNKFTIFFVLFLALGIVYNIFQVNFAGMMADSYSEYLRNARVAVLTGTFIGMFPLVLLFFQLIIVENRSSILFKRIALTKISKTKFLLINTAVALLPVLVIIFGNYIAFAVYWGAYENLNVLDIFGSWSFLRDISLLILLFVALSGLNFTLFNLIKSVTLWNFVMSMTSILLLTPFVLQAALRLILNWDIDVMLLIYLGVVGIFAILFWFIAFKKFAFHF